MQRKTKSNKYSYLWPHRIRVIKKRDNYQCQCCGHIGKQDSGDLDVHHIDSNRKNNNDFNLITLCKKCHLTKELKEYRDALLSWQKALLKEYYGREDIINIATGSKQK